MSNYNIILLDLTFVIFCFINSSFFESKALVASSRINKELFLRNALDIESLCLSPPLNLKPLSPIIVSYEFGKFSINS